MKTRVAKAGVALLLTLAIPTAAVLAHGAVDAQKGLATAAQHAQESVPVSVPVGHGADKDNTGNGDTENDTDGAGKPVVPGAPDSTEATTNRPHNHGWFVSQAAKDHSMTGKAHGAAVSKVARSNQGKPAGH